MYTLLGTIQIDNKSTDSAFSYRNVGEIEGGKPGCTVLAKKLKGESCKCKDDKELLSLCMHAGRDDMST
jgi:hypothetical protein